MRTPVTIQLKTGGQWHPAELRRSSDGSPVVVVAGQDVELHPEDVLYLRAGGNTDQILLAEAQEAGFMVIYGS
jgi:hypothetical protein